MADTGVMPTGKVLKLRRADNCAGCGSALQQGEDAWWEAEARRVWCLPCHEHRNATSKVGPEALPPHHSPVGTLERGEPGKSAQAEYDRRHANWDRRMNQKWGRLSGVAKFVSDDPRSTTAWAKGAAGERRVASLLEQAVGTRGQLLYDRMVPGTRGNIDVLAVASSGIWIIDVKHYQGKVERRDVGGWLRTDLRLYVGGRDRSRAIDGLDWQYIAVSQTIGDPGIPVHRVLCFDGAEWGLFSRPFEFKGVLVTWAKKLAEMILTTGQLDSGEVAELATLLARRLPAK